MESITPKIFMQQQETYVFENKTKFRVDLRKKKKQEKLNQNRLKLIQ